MLIVCYFNYLHNKMLTLSKQLKQKSLIIPTLLVHFLWS